MGLRTLVGVSDVIRGSTDEELLPLLAAGNPDAFSALYDRHVARVYTHCARQLGTVQDADDLTAVVFLEMWRHKGSIRSVSGSALPWLLMTATNVSRNHRRSLRRYRSALNRIPPPTRTPISPTMLPTGKRWPRRTRPWPAPFAPYVRWTNR